MTCVDGPFHLCYAPLMTMTPQAQFLRSVALALRVYTMAVKMPPAAPRLREPADANDLDLALQVFRQDGDVAFTPAQLAGLFCWTKPRMRAVVSKLRQTGAVHYARGVLRKATAPVEKPAVRRDAQIANVRRVLADGRTMASRDLYQAARIPQGSWPTVRDYMVRKGIIVASDLSNGKGFNFRLAPSELRASIKPEETTT